MDHSFISQYNHNHSSTLNDTACTALIMQMLPCICITLLYLFVSSSASGSESFQSAIQIKQYPDFAFLLHNIQLCGIHINVES